MSGFSTIFTEAAEARVALVGRATGLTREHVIVCCTDLGLRMMERQIRGERFSTTLPDGETVPLTVALLTPEGDGR